MERSVIYILSSHIPSINQEQNCIQAGTQGSEMCVEGTVKVIWFSLYLIRFHLNVIIWDSPGQQGFTCTSWAWTHYVAEKSFEILILPPLFSKCLPGRRHRVGGCGSVMECLHSLPKTLNWSPAPEKGSGHLKIKGKRDKTNSPSIRHLAEWPRPPSLSVGAVVCLFQYLHLVSVWLWANYLI